MSTAGGARTVELRHRWPFHRVLNSRALPRAPTSSQSEKSSLRSSRLHRHPAAASPKQPDWAFAAAIVPAQGSEDSARVDGITVFTVSDLAILRFASYFLQTRAMGKQTTHSGGKTLTSVTHDFESSRAVALRHPFARD